MTALHNTPAPEWPALDPIEAAESADAPRLAPRTRTRLYVGGLIVSAVYGVVAGSAALFVPEHAPAVVAVAGLLGTAYGSVSAGLGVAFRPTR